MQNRSDRRRSTNLRSLVISAFIIAVAVVAVPFYSVRSSSLPKGASQASAPSRAIENANKVGSFKFGISPINGSYSGWSLMALSAPPDPESIVVSPPGVRLPGCTDPGIMCLGEVVSAQVSNAPLRVDFRERRIQWIAPDGTVPRIWNVDEDPETDTYTLDTMGAFAQVGTWTVRTINNRGGGVVVATFEVIEPNQPSVDLTLSMTGPATVAPNDAATYTLTLTNSGPDAAANVILRNPVPYNSTFASASPAAGFSCTAPEASQSGDIECTATSLAMGVPAVFTFTFTINPDVSQGTEVVNFATAESSTNESNTNNNYAFVASNSGAPDPGTDACDLTCPGDMVVTANTTQSGNPGRFVSYSAASGFGNCGAISNSPGSGSFFAVGGPYTVTSTAMTAGPDQIYGNSDDVMADSCTFTVTVLDSAPPTISCPPTVVVTAPSGSDEALANPGLPSTTGSGTLTLVGVRSDDRPAEYDQNGIEVVPAVVHSLTADPYPVGTTGIFWTVKDLADRTASCNQSITVQAVARDLLTISCPANVNTTAPSGNCEATVTLDNPTTNPSDSHVTFVGVRSDGELLTAPYPAGVTQITWTATDDVNDNVASCTQSVNVTGTDGIAPTLHIPANISVTTSSCSATLDDELGVATADDNCTPSVNVVRTGVPANFVFPTGTTVITYTATDAAGNTAVGTQMVTVTESTPPTITAPASLLTLNTGGAGGTFCGTFVSDATLGTATANDNCPGVTVVRTGVPAGNNFPVGDTIVTYTATDASLNTAQAFQTVRVADNTPPVITSVPSGGQTDAGSCTATIPDVATGTVASDNCAIFSKTQTPAAGTAVGLGTHTITVRVTDTASPGNFTEQTTTFTVNALQFETKFWLGLKNSDDVGTKFDLRAEVRKNTVLVGSAEIYGENGGSSGFNNASLRTIAAALSSTGFCTGDNLSVTLLVRVAANSGHVSGTARLWYNDSAANSRFNKIVNGVPTSDYLRKISNNLVLNASTGPLPKLTIDVFVHRNQGGNPFKPFGTWTKTF